MAGNETDIATQFSTNELSSNMVVVSIVIIIIICIDRVLYSTHAFMSGTRTTYEERENANARDAVVDDASAMTDSNDADVSMLHRQSGQPYGRR